MQLKIYQNTEKHDDHDDLSGWKRQAKKILCPTPKKDYGLLQKSLQAMQNHLINYEHNLHEMCIFPKRYKFTKHYLGKQS